MKDSIIIASHDSRAPKSLVCPTLLCSEQILALFSKQLSEKLKLEAEEMIKKRQILDFFIQPGKVSAKIEDESGEAHRLEISFDKLSESTWKKILFEFANNTCFLALLLAGKLHQDIESLFKKYDSNLFPSSLNEISITFDYNEISKMLPSVCALVFRLCDKLDKDPFSIFLLRGKGREEILSRIHKYRAEIYKSSDNIKKISSNHSPTHDSAPPLSTTIENYWSCKKDLWDISYDIKADELPSSILKWLDPPPLSGLESDVELELELAYEKVTRLAQGLGLTYNSGR